MVALVLLDKAQGQTTGANVFADRAALLAARDAWCTNSTAASVTYGPIGQWDVSQITDLSYLFCACEVSWTSGSPCNRTCASFNDDISAWNVSQVTTLKARRAAPPV